MVTVPKNRPPIHPGEVLVEEYLVPLRISQVEAAKLLGITFQRVNGIARGRRAITPDTALRLAKVFGTTPTYWLNMQQVVDLYAAEHSKEAPGIARLKPVPQPA